MMTDTNHYHAPKWMKGGHAQTISPKLFRYPKAPFRRELRLDSTGKTQVAYDFIDALENAPTVVLFHGLEGSSRSHYAESLAREVHRRNWRLIVVHFRSCGGVPNTAPVFYHAGDSFEIAFVLNQLKKEFHTLYAAGVSLGGNALAKYLGEHNVTAVCEAAAVISAPLDLPAASIALNRPFARTVYAPYFLKTLIPKAIEFTGDSLEKWKDCTNLRDFDNRFTSQLYNFIDADDYYHHASAMPHLKNITVPTLIINAKNDPFFPPDALPTEEDVSMSVSLLQPEEGGHVGFVDLHRKDVFSWLPETVLNFFEKPWE